MCVCITYAFVCTVCCLCACIVCLCVCVHVCACMYVYTHGLHYLYRLTSTLTIAYHGTGSGRGCANRDRRHIQVYPDWNHTEGEEGQGAKGEAEQDNCQDLSGCPGIHALFSTTVKAFASLNPFSEHQISWPLHVYQTTLQDGTATGHPVLAIKMASLWLLGRNCGTKSLDVHEFARFQALNFIAWWLNERALPHYWSTSTSQCTIWICRYGDIACVCRRPKNKKTRIQDWKTNCKGATTATTATEEPSFKNIACPSNKSLKTCLPNGQQQEPSWLVEVYV